MAGGAQLRSEQGRAVDAPREQGGGADTEAGASAVRGEQNAVRGGEAEATAAEGEGATGVQVGDG